MAATKKKKLKPKINTPLGGIIDGLSYIKIFMLIFASILLFSSLFYFINPLMQLTNKEELSFVNSVYFNIVTFTTLGYGDINPIGIGKLFIVIEVLLGLFLAAIFIAKISSERQSTKLTLIYSSINHQRIIDLKNELIKYWEDINQLYIDHNNSELKLKTIELYDLVSVIRKYLILQSLEGELTKYGNSSTLNRLYIALSKIQILLVKVNRTYGISMDIKKINIRTVDSINRIGQVMKELHKNGKINILDELIKVHKSYQENQKIIYRTEISPSFLEEFIKLYKSEGKNSQIDIVIKKRFGISNKFYQKCLLAISES